MNKNNLTPTWSPFAVVKVSLQQLYRHVGGQDAPTKRAKWKPYPGYFANLVCSLPFFF